MKKTDDAIIEALRQHAKDHPGDTYAQLAATFGLSLITVKRHCADLGRSKNWRRGKKQAKADEGRFWAGVDRSGQGCWEWRGSRNNFGYGSVHFHGKSEVAHRVAYTLSYGTIPEGMDLDHKCRNRACCNPTHLEPVTHSENMMRAGIIPARRDSSIDTHTASIATVGPIDTPNFDVPSSANNGVVPLIKDNSIQEQFHDTPSPLIPVSIMDPKPNGDTGVRRTKSGLSTPRPLRPDPYAPICIMEEPPALELVQRPERHEASSGTKQDLGIDDWAMTEFGDFWWRQTDEEIQNRSVSVQTETMREEGEFLHWYRVQPANSEDVATYMSARTGPEACAKVDRCRGKGWAHSWEYLRPDPHRGSFFQHSVKIRYEGEVLSLLIIARTAKDAIAMVESVWSPGHVLSSESRSRPSDGELQTWVERWRELLSSQRAKIVTRFREKQTARRSISNH